MAFIYNEEIGDSSPQQTSASLRTARAQWVYSASTEGLIDIDARASLVSSLVDIFGNGSNVAVGNGALQRKLPTYHPLYSWMYATGLSSIRGHGAKDMSRVPASDGSTGASAISTEFALWPNYQYVVDFAPLPYAVADDTTVNRVSTHWIGKNGTPINYIYASEWVRFTNWLTTPSFESVTFNQGQMRFATEPTTLPAYKKVFSAFPKIFLPNQLLTFYWYGIPMRYVTSPNSYLNFFPGRINQSDWYNWEAGQLLYLGYKYTPYTAPLPQLVSFPVTGFDGLNVPIGTVIPTVFSQAKLIDLEIQFLLTTRVSDDAPIPANGNYIAAGHNLLPWYQDRSFHYGTVTSAIDTPANAVPSWLSFPFQLLFTDPDYPQINNQFAG